MRHFRCFDAYAAEFGPGLNFIVGPNARGKTSLLEAVCILLRLQSPRVSRLAHVIRHGRRGFVVDGYLRVPDSKEPRRMQFYFGRERKKLALDGVEQGTAQEYLQMGRVMWFANTDMEIARGSGDVRRRFLDFLGSQRDLRYRQALRDFERAVRSRNLLLKQSPPRWREIEAFEEPLIAAGDTLMEIRVGMIAELQPLAAEAHETISGGREALEITYVPSGKDNLAQTIASARENDARLRQTTVGPHRDELAFTLNGIPASYASEGQQRTIVLSLKLGAARLLQAKFGTPPLLLLDDIFGELDVARRQALLAALPAGSQKLISTTFLDWAGKDMDARVLQLDAAAS